MSDAGHWVAAHSGAGAAKERRRTRRNRGYVVSAELIGAVQVLAEEPRLHLKPLILDGGSNGCALPLIRGCCHEHAGILFPGFTYDIVAVAASEQLGARRAAHRRVDEAVAAVQQEA